MPRGRLLRRRHCARPAGPIGCPARRHRATARATTLRLPAGCRGQIDPGCDPHRRSSSIFAAGVNEILRAILKTLPPASQTKNHSDRGQRRLPHRIARLPARAPAFTRLRRSAHYRGSHLEPTYRMSMTPTTDNRIDRKFRELKARRTKSLRRLHHGGRPQPGGHARSRLGPRTRRGRHRRTRRSLFSDPLADGVVNQLSAQRALEAGTTTARIFEILQAVRKQSQIPIVLYTYFNLIYAYGIERFCLPRPPGWRGRPSSCSIFRRRNRRAQPASARDSETAACAASPSSPRTSPRRAHRPDHREGDRLRLLRLAPRASPACRNTLPPASAAASISCASIPRFRSASVSASPRPSRLASSRSRRTAPSSAASSSTASPSGGRDKDLPGKARGLCPPPSPRRSIPSSLLEGIGQRNSSPAPSFSSFTGKILRCCHLDLAHFAGDRDRRELSVAR